MIVENENLPEGTCLVNFLKPKLRFNPNIKGSLIKTRFSSKLINRLSISSDKSLLIYRLQSIYRIVSQSITIGLLDNFFLSYQFTCQYHNAFTVSFKLWKIYKRRLKIISPIMYLQFIKGLKNRQLYHLIYKDYVK